MTIIEPRPDPQIYFGNQRRLFFCPRAQTTTGREGWKRKRLIEMSHHLRYFIITQRIVGHHVLFHPVEGLLG